MVIANVVSQWPLLLEAMPGQLLDIQFTTDGELICSITAARLAVVLVRQDQEDLFAQTPWRDRAEVMRDAVLDLVRTWDPEGLDARDRLRAAIEALSL